MEDYERYKNRSDLSNNCVTINYLYNRLIEKYQPLETKEYK